MRLQRAVRSPACPRVTHFGLSLSITSPQKDGCFVIVILLLCPSETLNNSEKKIRNRNAGPARTSYSEKVISTRRFAPRAACAAHYARS